jgi:hypothetical protein
VHCVTRADANPGAIFEPFELFTTDFPLLRIICVRRFEVPVFPFVPVTQIVVRGIMKRESASGQILSIIMPGVLVPLLKILSSKNAETLPTITAIKNLNLPIFSKSFLCLRVAQTRNILRRVPEAVMHSS